MRNSSIILAVLLCVTGAFSQGLVKPSTGGGGGSGTVTSVATSNGLSGGTITTSGTISGVNAAADGSTIGVSTFTASDFNSASGVISTDYTNGQAATGSVKGFLTSADWTTFNNKVPTTRTVAGYALSGDVTLTDTISKANVFTSLAAADTLFLFRADQSGLTARSVYVKAKGGSSLTLNVIRVRASSASALRSSNFSATIQTSFLAAMETFGSLQNTGTNIGDEFYAVPISVSGTITDLTVQITFDKAQK